MTQNTTAPPKRINPFAVVAAGFAAICLALALLSGGGINLNGQTAAAASNNLAKTTTVCSSNTLASCQDDGREIYSSINLSDRKVRYAETTAYETYMDLRGIKERSPENLQRASQLVATLGTLKTHFDQPAATASPQPSASAASCPAEYVQRPASRNNNRLDADGVETSDEYIAGMGTDALQLAGRAALLSQAGKPLWDDPNNRDGLVTADGTCLTPRGQELHRTVKIILLSMEIDNNAVIPATATNTGVSGENIVQASSPGVTGDLSGICYVRRVSGEIAQQHCVLKRCANITLFNASSLPKGKTDEPERPTKTATPKPSRSTPPVTRTTPPPVTRTTPPTRTPKDPKAGASVRGNIPTQVGGKAPEPERTSKPRPSSPPETYTPPPPPKPKPTPTSNPTKTVNPTPTPRPTVPPPPPAPEPTGSVDPGDLDPCTDPTNPVCG